MEIYKSKDLVSVLMFLGEMKHLRLHNTKEGQVLCEEENCPLCEVCGDTMKNTPFNAKERYLAKSFQHKHMYWVNIVERDLKPKVLMHSTKVWENLELKNGLKSETVYKIMREEKEFMSRKYIQDIEYIELDEVFENTEGVKLFTQDDMINHFRNRKLLEELAEELNVRLAKYLLSSLA